jgi:hypothetical protein
MSGGGAFNATDPETGLSGESHSVQTIPNAHHFRSDEVWMELPATEQIAVTD